MREEEEEEEAFSGETSQTKVSWRERTSQQVTVSLTWESDLGVYLLNEITLMPLGFLKIAGDMCVVWKS